MTIKQCKLSMLHSNYYTFLSESLKVRNVIWRTKYLMKALYQCTKIGQSFQHNKNIICSGLIRFLFKSLNVFNFSAASKNLITNSSFFINSSFNSLTPPSFAEQINGLVSIWYRPPSWKSLTKSYFMSNKLLASSFFQRNFLAL